MKIAQSLLLVAVLMQQARAAKAVDVYDIDVEGWKCVLIVSPAGESMLVDVGWPGFNGRDTDRILTALKAAGLTQIDYLVTPHYDIDLLGDVPLLSKLPAKHIVDRGPMEANKRLTPRVKGLRGRGRQAGPHHGKTWRPHPHQGQDVPKK